MLVAYSKKCDQCLFSKNKIVSDERKKDVLDQCEKDNTHFVCHKSSMENGKVACAGWLHHYAAMKEKNLDAKTTIRIGELTGALKLIEHKPKK